VDLDPQLLPPPAAFAPVAAARIGSPILLLDAGARTGGYRRGESIVLVVGLLPQGFGSVPGPFGLADNLALQVLQRSRLAREPGCEAFPVRPTQHCFVSELGSGAPLLEVCLYPLEPLEVLEGLELENIEQFGVEAWVVLGEQGAGRYGARVHLGPQVENAQDADAGLFRIRLERSFGLLDESDYPPRQKEAARISGSRRRPVLLNLPFKIDQLATLIGKQLHLV